MGKIVSFSNQKGGVGKTTTCVNMAAYIAESGKKVLLIDIDPQGNATTGFGFSKSSLKKSVYNVLIDDEPAADNILKTEVDSERAEYARSSSPRTRVRKQAVLATSRESCTYSP